MVPDDRISFIDLVMVEEVVLPGWAVEESRGLWNVVDGERQAVFLREVRIEAAKVLALRRIRSAGRREVGNIGDAVETVT